MAGDAEAMSLLRADPKPTPRPKKRRKWMRRKRARRIEKQTPEDRRYLAWLHTQPCVGAESVPRHECLGRIEAAHFRDVTGASRKEPDTTCIPLCQSLHGDYDQARGYFYGIPRDERKLWHQSQQLRMRIRYEAEALRGLG